MVLYPTLTLRYQIIHTSLDLDQSLSIGPKLVKNNTNLFPLPLLATAVAST